MRQLQSVSYGYPNRAYAKWLVLNFLWGIIKDDIESQNSELRFRHMCEHHSSELKPLINAIENIFMASLTFYRLNRGKKEEAKDISSFFGLSGLHIKFRKFWYSAKNPYKSKFDTNMKKFRIKLNSLEAS